MYIIETELRNEFAALTRTTETLRSCRAEIEEALKGVTALCVLGCGSSFSIAKSAAALYYQRTGNPGFALPAGDLLVNFDDYRKMLAGSAVLILSRSGSTSEAVRAAARCKEELGCRILSLCASVDTPVEEIADWNLSLPWAFDEAVCQTRTVVNLYAAALGMVYIAAGDRQRFDLLCGLSRHAEEFCPAQETALAGIARRPWVKAAVLGDSGAAGLLEEGALAFKEICRRDSNHYHLLDVRHGPMVQIGKDTLVIAMLSSGDRTLQKALLADLKFKTDHLLVLDAAGKDGEGVPGLRIALPDHGPDEQRAVYALYCIQLVCFYHALARGVDPDRPEGLAPWISL